MTIEAAEPLRFPDEPTRFSLPELDRLLVFAAEHEVSDITLQSQEPVIFDRHGRLCRVTRRALLHGEVSDILNGVYGANGVTQILSGTDVDTQYEVRPSRGKRYRFRVNGTGCFVAGQEGLQLTLRTIPLAPPELCSMHLPPALVRALMPYQGIVIVAGATGSGKTTLLAAIMREILETQNGKILTYESPIEFVYDGVSAPRTVMSQHEIPKHLPNFPMAVRNALRRKPHYILVGEARDKETIAAVIDAALTGHTVYTTVHANGVADTFRRMTAAFPEEERYARTVDLLAMTRVVIWQMLVPTRDGKRQAVREWIVLTPGMRDKLLADVERQTA